MSINVEFELRARVVELEDQVVVLGKNLSILNKIIVDSIGRLNDRVDLLEESITGPRREGRARGE